MELSFFSNLWLVAQSQLERDDLGQHLLGVEDILQKHSLLQQDIVVHGERVKEIDEQSKEFLTPTEEGISYYSITYFDTRRF